MDVIELSDDFNYPIDVDPRILQRRSEHNYQAALALEEQLFAERSRHLILVLTLNYKKEARPFVTLEHIANDRERFFNNARSNPFLQGIEAVLWKLEEGPKAGVHMHAIIFFDGRSTADIPIAETIGNYWVNVVTKGNGAFCNQNKYWRRYEQHSYGNATGQIDRGDSAKREILREVFKYFAKSDQQVSSRNKRHQKMFGIRWIS